VFCQEGFICYKNMRMRAGSSTCLRVSNHFVQPLQGRDEMVLGGRGCWMCINFLIVDDFYIKVLLRM
jgi:hypothetical protein